MRRRRIPEHGGAPLPVDAVDLSFRSGAGEEGVPRRIPGQCPHTLGVVEADQLAGLSIGADRVDAAFGEGAGVERSVVAEGQRGHQELPGLREGLHPLAAQAEDSAVVAGAEIDGAVAGARRGVDERDVVWQGNPLERGARLHAAVGADGGVDQLARRERVGVVEHEALGGDGAGRAGEDQRQRERARREHERRGAGASRVDRCAFHGRGVLRTWSSTRAFPFTTWSSSMLCQSVVTKGRLRSPSLRSWRVSRAERGRSWTTCPPKRRPREGISIETTIEVRG